MISKQLYAKRNECNHGWLIIRLSASLSYLKTLTSGASGQDDVILFDGHVIAWFKVYVYIFISRIGKLDVFVTY